MLRVRPSFNEQRGVALLVILLVVAIISILATEMVARLQLNIARTINIKDNNQAYWYAIGAEQFAQKSLGELKALSPSNINLSQPWAQVFEYPIDGGGIQAELVDLQACFNLNTLGPTAVPSVPNTEREGPVPVPDETPNDSTNTNNPSAAPKTPAEAFYNLLTLSSANIDSFTAETLRDSLIDWLDADSNITDLGAEDADYEALQFPYVAANALMGNKSELRLINGVELSFLRDVLPFVCVIPDVEYNKMEVNINTITEDNAVVLAALLNLPVEDASRIIASRPEDGFSDLAAFFAEPEVARQNLTQEQKEWFILSTNYFMLRTKTRYNEAGFKMTSIFKLDGGSSSEGVSVISREFGGIN
ncbi:type II secretion system minor pseudopilin GspK [Glaciecola sp. MH2013]|uniref:type II secretion system minor pseudopilin GspK n=1 Tax=Glaciecola sp. MH2013 TaxID=2785524 RepID=UPI00189F1765|nr:type II secretion system minor pseudopilin GspK [Glaciecola sp. MH2013]MBF7074359.1 type II secretion system minor pseudopilin GspK [Glaciecola sp. MH2013]